MHSAQICDHWRLAVLLQVRIMSSLSEFLLRISDAGSGESIDTSTIW
jgi:hypothetical protein